MIGFFETSAKEAINVELAFKTLISNAMSHIKANSQNNSIKSKIDISKKDNSKSNKCC